MQLNSFGWSVSTSQHFLGPSMSVKLNAVPVGLLKLRTSTYNNTWLVFNSLKLYTYNGNIRILFENEHSRSCIWKNIHSSCSL